MAIVAQQIVHATSINVARRKHCIIPATLRFTRVELDISRASTKRKAIDSNVVRSPKVCSSHHIISNETNKHVKKEDREEGATCVNQLDAWSSKIKKKFDLPYMIPSESAMPKCPNIGSSHVRTGMGVKTMQQGYRSCFTDTPRERTNPASAKSPMAMNSILSVKRERAAERRQEDPKGREQYYCARRGEEATEER